MSFQARVLLLVSLLLAITVLATAVALTWAALRAIWEDEVADTVMIARVLVHSVEFAEREQQGLARLLDSLVDGEDILAIQVIDAHGQRLAASTIPGLQINMEVTEADLRAVLDQGHTISYLDGTILKVITPDDFLDEAQAGNYKTCKARRTRSAQERIQAMFKERVTYRWRSGNV
jgi:sensor histidine kinase regulating citrate/malate metabolism